MKKFLFSISLITAFSIFSFGTVAFAQNFGLDETAGAAKLNTYGNSVPTIAGNIIGTLLSMISVLFFVLVLYGGILWMTARGNSEQTTKALDTIIAATIGIIIIMGAYALTNFVFKLGNSNGGGGGGTTTELSWCLTAENQCIQGGGSPCSGTSWTSEAACTAAKSGTAQCGNGQVEGEEQCDDGNTVNNDACTNACQNTSSVGTP